MTETKRTNQYRHSPKVDTPEQKPQRGSPVNVTEAELFKLACSFEEFSIPSLDPDVIVRTGLHNLDDVTSYNVTMEQQKDLWKREISRLLHVTEDSTKPLQFMGMNQLDGDTKHSYEKLAQLANEIWVAFNVASLDSGSIVARHCPDLFNKNEYKRCRAYLEKLGKVDDDDEDEDDQSPPLTESCKPQPREFFELVNYITAILARIMRNAAYGKSWHAITLVCLAKLSTKLKILGVHSEVFIPISLSNAPDTSYSFLLGDSRHRNGGGNDEGDEQGLDLEGGIENRGNEAKILTRWVKALLTPTKTTYSGPETRRKMIKELYWLCELRIRRTIHGIFRNILLTLRGNRTALLSPSTCYEACAIVYDTGLDGTPNMVYQDTDGELLGSSRPEALNVAYAVFNELNMAIKDIQSRHDQEQGREVQATEREFNAEATQNAPGNSPTTSATTASQSESNSSSSVLRSGSPNPTTASSPPKSDGSTGSTSRELVGTTFSWSFIDSTSNPKQKKDCAMNLEEEILSLKSLNDIIQVMIPLFVSNTIILDAITDLIGICAETPEIDSYRESLPTDLYDQPKYVCTFYLTTNEYRLLGERQERKQISVSQLSKAQMGGDKLLAWDAPVKAIGLNDGLPIHKVDTSKVEPDIHERGRMDCIKLTKSKLEEARGKMDDWIFEQDGVRVECAQYFWVVLAITTILVFGGLIIGLTVQTRIKGVDPFNITMFCWGLAAFLVLVAKSIRVEVWPWRDFLRRRVLCRSVSELHSVTRVDEQVILTKLLQSEQMNILKTKGPYNCIFSRKAEGTDGFSIDRPLNLRTMLLGGLIPVRVSAAYRKEYLVFLDLRRGDFSYIERSNTSTNKKTYIVSERLKDTDRDHPNCQRIPLKSKTKLGWGKILGIYNRKDAVFT
ncbi:hypothetical protein AA313_de0200196 [Arthrobotrys entomopaga]|nr:hypothetical protein AA313_de0200196 [Arthrobotrys entomopaga]